ncbi:MAG: PEP-utilizing enzyme [Gemmatimonadales bacterium]
MIDPGAVLDKLATGLPASPGAASGQIVFDADVAADRARAGDAVILVRRETSPEDFHGMVAAKAVLTARGGMTSHAAVVARGMGKPCVAGAQDLEVDEALGTVRVGDRAAPRRRLDHARREHRHCLCRPGEADRARARRALPHANGLGRPDPADEGPRQRRHRGRRAPEPRLTVPRGSASAAPSTCSSTATASSRCAR